MPIEPKNGPRKSKNDKKRKMKVLEEKKNLTYVTVTSDTVLKSEHINDRVKVQRQIKTVTFFAGYQ